MTTVRIHSKKKDSCQRSLSPTRLVNTSRFWLTGTDAATRTVVAGHGDCEYRLLGTFELEALGRRKFEAFRSVLHGGFVNNLHADGCMRVVVYVRSGYILGAIGCAYACRSPPRTKPRCVGLVPKGALSLMRKKYFFLN